MNRLLAIIFLLLPVSLLGQGFDGTALTGTNIAIGGQAGWSLIVDSDSPEGAYGHVAVTGTSNITALVTLPVTIPAGPIRVLAKVIGYTPGFSAHMAASMGGGTNWLTIDDQDGNGFWTTALDMTSTSATNQIAVNFFNAATDIKIRWLILYVTTNLNEYLDPNGKDTIYNYTYPAATNSTVANTYNVLPVSSFEAGLGGWRPSVINRRDSMTNWISFGTAQAGNAALKFPEYGTVTTPYFYPKPDSRFYNISTYYTGQLTITVKTPITAPAGFSNTISVSKVLPAVATWTRTNFTAPLMNYPELTPYYLEIIGASNTLVDAVMVVEGLNAVTFATASALEIGWSNSVPSGVYYTNSALQPYIVVHQTSGTNRSITVNYEFSDQWNKVAASGSYVTTMSDGGYSSTPVSLPTTPGYYRAVCWADGVSPQENMIVYIPPPNSGTFVGTHNFPRTWQFVGMSRLGINWDRAMSPDGSTRWFISPDGGAEPTDGVFSFYNEYYRIATNYNTTVFGVLGAVNSVSVPSYAGDWDATDMADWQNHSWTMVSNYFVAEPLIPYVGLFNEPQQGSMAVTNYIGLLTNAVPLLRALSPTVKIAGLGGSATAAYINQVMGGIDQNTRTNINILDIHGYPEDSDPFSSGAPIAQALGWKDNLITPYCTNGVLAWNSESGQWDWGAKQTEQKYVTVGGGVYAYQHNRPYFDGLMKVPWQISQHALAYKAVGFDKYFYYDSRNITDPEWTDNHTASWEGDDSHRPKIAVLAIANQIVAGTTGGGLLANVPAHIAILYYENAGNSRAAIWSTNAAYYDASMATVTPFDHFLRPKTYAANHFVIGRMPTYVYPVGLTSAQFQTVLTNATFTSIADTNPPGVNIFTFPGAQVSDRGYIRVGWSTVDELSIPSKNTQQALLTRSKLSTDADFDAWSTLTLRVWTNAAAGALSVTVQARDAASNVVSQTRILASSDSVTTNNVTVIVNGGVKVNGAVISTH